MSDVRYLSCAETAKLVRKTLAQAFPGVKFYVNSSNYSMGASIDVAWVDGPTRKEVDAVAGVFEGKDFDGMIDMGCYWKHWLLPDGTVRLASGSGTQGSMGTIPAVNNPKPHPDAELVSWGSDYVHTERTHTRELLERVAREVSEETGWPIPEIVDGTSYLTRNKQVSSAYFKRDWTKTIPGSDQELEVYYNRRLWETSAYTPPEQAQPTKPDNPGKDSSDGGYFIEYDRDWTWVQFDGKPTLEVREALKAIGARWSRKRSAWYIRQRVDFLTIGAAIG